MRLTVLGIRLPTLTGDSGELAWFRRFLCAKVCLNWLASGGSILLVITLVVGTILSFYRKGYVPGLIIVLAFSIAEVLATFPYTINHKAYESVILLLLTVTARGDVAQAKHLSSAACDVCRISILSVWSYSGIQKVVSNYYLSGEIFVLAVRQGAPDLSEALRFLIEFIYGLDVARLHAKTDAFGVTPSPYLVEIIVLLQAFAIAVVAAELLLPIWALKSRYGAVALIGLNVVVVVFTGEWDIAFTCVGGLLLFFPSFCPIAYPALITLYAFQLAFPLI